MLRVARATEDDLLPVLELAGRMHSESPRYSPFPIDPTKLAEIVTALITHDDGLLLVAYDGDNLIGMFWGFIDEIFFSRVRVSADLLLYITPEHRGCRLATRLVRGYEDWARAAGVTEIQVGVSAGIEDELATKLYERLGYTTVGRTLKKEARDV